MTNIDSIHANIVARLANKEIMVVKKARSCLNKVRRIRAVSERHYEVLISDIENGQVTYANIGSNEGNYGLLYMDDKQLRELASFIVLGADIIVGWER